MQSLGIFFSNRIESLYSSFKEALFASSHPLTKRFVIVPSAAMKAWLMRQMAQDPDLGISAGVQIGFVEPSINHIFQVVAGGESEERIQHYEPSEWALALAIECELHKIIKAFDSMPAFLKMQWRPVLNYLHISEKECFMNRRSAKRASALASVTAKLFLDYGKYGGRMIAEWETDNCSHWQQHLWMALERRFFLWEYPYRKLEAISMDPQIKPADLQIHVFGLSYIAPLHHRFFLKLGTALPVQYYLLSPCLKFWGDILSQKESMKLQQYWRNKGVSFAEQEKLEEYLFDHNPLLANFGRLGREMMSQIELSDAPIEELYSLPAFVLGHKSYQDLVTDEIVEERQSGPLTLLESVQADIALLRNPDKEKKISFDCFDGTIQIHAAPKPMREVQAIYNAIVGIFQKHLDDDEPLTPSDVVVMAPNIGDYAPFIRSVFGSSESLVDYHLMDLQAISNNSFVKSFMHLIGLPFGRWDAESLLRLFEFPSFQAKHGLTLEDIDVIRRWIKEAGIRWGKDADHRNELLKRDHCKKEIIDHCATGTWEHGFGRLLDGLMIAADEQQLISKEIEYSPLETIETTHGELLGSVLNLFYSILADLKPLGDGTELSLSNWSNYLKCLCDSYFSYGDDEDDQKGYQILVQQIQAFADAGKALPDASFAFDSIRRHLEKGLQAQTIAHKETQLQKVRFCSLLPMRSVPAKVVVLMGMNDHAFPRSDDQLSFNLLQKNPKADYYPTQMDFDRYLFLEALLSSRKYFVLSYLSTNEEFPSLLVRELLDYLDKAYEAPGGAVSSLCHYKHPMVPFDKRYFQPGSPLQSYFNTHYAAALAYAKSDRKSLHNFVPDFNLSCPVQEEENQILDLADLLAFSKNPLKVYLNKTLGLYLDKEENRQIACEDDLVLSKLNSSVLSKKGIFTDPSAVLASAEKNGKLPQGPFKILGKEEILNKINAYRANLSQQGVAPEEIFSIEFSDKHHIPSLEGDNWTLPALHINVPKVGNICLIGKIPYVAKKGLIILEEDKIQKAIEIWPTVLVFCCLIKAYQLPIAHRVIFSKEQSTVKEASFSDPENLLRHYLEYYYIGKSNPSPLMPEAVPNLLEGSVDKMKKSHVIDEFKTIYDEYVKWFIRSSPEINFESALVSWQEIVQNNFSLLSSSWYKPGGSDVV